MKCLKCTNDKFIEELTFFDPEIKGEIVEITIPCIVCAKCKTPFVDGERMNLLRREAADMYRKKHKLLTSAQIVAYRETLGMSQIQFARYLNVGEASIKRWETCFVQDASQDDHIRVKCDAAYAEMNFLNVHWKLDEPDIFSGNKKFNLQIFKQVALFLAKETKASLIYLNKFHFYNDFLHFLKKKSSMTGARYVPLKYGPCPDQYKSIYDSLVRGGFLRERPNHSYEVLVEPDLNLLDFSEIETLRQIVKLHKSMGAKEVYELSHKEKAYTETPECNFISYEYAKDLQILKKL